MQKDIAINLKGRVMNNFSCNDCVGMCCACPPAMSSEDEILFAIDSSKRVIAMDHGDRYSVSVAKDGQACPYLNEEGKCSIYNDRFAVCKSFECKALDEGKEDLVRGHGYMDMIKKLTEHRYSIPGAVFFSEGIINKHNIEVVDVDEWVQLVNGVDASFAIAEVIKIIEKNT